MTFDLQLVQDWDMAKASASQIRAHLALNSVERVRQTGDLPDTFDRLMKAENMLSAALSDASGSQDERDMQVALIIRLRNAQERAWLDWMDAQDDAIVGLPY